VTDFGDRVLARWTYSCGCTHERVLWERFVKMHGPHPGYEHHCGQHGVITVRIVEIFPIDAGDGAQPSFVRTLR